MAGLGYSAPPPPPPPTTSIETTAPRVFHVNPHVENMSAASFLELCKQNKVDSSYMQLRIPPGFIPPPIAAKSLPDEDQIFDDYEAAIAAMRNGETIVDGACRLLRRSSNRDSRDRDRSRSYRRDRSPGDLFVCLFLVLI
jgi:hypothetical protein